MPSKMRTVLDRVAYLGIGCIPLDKGLVYGQILFEGANVRKPQTHIHPDPLDEVISCAWVSFCIKLYIISIQLEINFLQVLQQLQSKVLNIMFRIWNYITIYSYSLIFRITGHIPLMVYHSPSQYNGGFTFQGYILV